jgi:hypothetical protein
MPEDRAEKGKKDGPGRKKGAKAKASKEEKEDRMRMDDKVGDMQ